MRDTMNADTAILEQRKPRTDMRTRDLVNQAVASVPTLGLQRAAEFLAAMNVPASSERSLVWCFPNAL